MSVVGALIGVIQLIIAILFAIVALYLGFWVMDRVTRGIDEQKELARGNTAVGILIAAVFISIGIVVQSGVAGLAVGITSAFTQGLFTADGLAALLAAILQLIVGIALAIIAIYLALNFLDRLTTKINEWEEIKKGNNAVALEMAGVIIAVAVIIQQGVIGITAALF
jgi:uncharacterized membrane protein YjfL (UPF0719 family)